MMKKTAILPGTFDPFTIGHASLVERSLKIVDEVIIAIGKNDSKQNHFPLEKRISMIENLYRGDSRISVQAYDGLTADFAKKIGANVIVRGVRSVNDYEYEKTSADINKKIADIETVVLFTEPEFTHISSTIVRELLRFGHDISDFVPKGMITT